MDHRRNNAQDGLRCHLCETPAPPMYCDICNLNLCKPCVGEHLSDESTEHKVVPFRKRGSTLYCSKHSTKLCYLHCEQCDIPICVQCVSSDEHLGHKQNDILKFIENRNEALQKDLKELENSIYPKHQKIASNISVQKSDLCENSKKLKTTLDEQGEILHREIDNVLKELKNDVDKIETRYLTVLDKQEGEIKGNISDIIQIIADVKKLINSNDVSLVSSYTSKFAEFRRFPPKLKVVLPSLSPQKINKQQIYQQFGSLSADGITPQDYAFKSNFPRTLSSHQDIVGEKDMLVHVDTIASLSRQLDEMRMRHASEAHCQTKEASIKQKQLIESAAPQSPYQYPGNFNNPYSSQPHRGPYPAWTTKPGASHENRKPLKQSLGQKIEFTSGDDSQPSTPTVSISIEAIQDKLHQLLIKEKAENEVIFDWIEESVDDPTKNSNTFIRALMTSVCESAITGFGRSARVLPEVIKNRGDLLQKYLDHQAESELQALYALQYLVHRLEHPQGVLRTLFDTLYDEEIISEDGFNQWEKSKDPNEQEGKGVAMKQVVQFFTWLREDEDDSDSWG